MCQLVVMLTSGSQSTTEQEQYKLNLFEA